MDGREINFLDAYADIFIGFFDMKTGSTFLPPDPRFCTFEMELVQFDSIANGKVKLKVNKAIELAPVL